MQAMPGELHCHIAHRPVFGSRFRAESPKMRARYPARGDRTLREAGAQDRGSSSNGGSDGFPPFRPGRVE
jgi:hypothetical protein